MKRAIKLKPLQCPCCKELRPESECCVFISQIAREVPNKYYGTLQGRIIGNIYWLDAQKNKVDWACDICLQQNRALRGKPKRQLFCGFAPHFSYFDKQVICRDCGITFLFSKEQQVHYYEKLVFWVQAERVRCNACQALKKSHELLSQLLVKPDYSDLNKVKQIIELRIELKQYQQAKHFLALGKKHHTKGSEAPQTFDNLKQQVDKAEKSDSNQ